LPIHNIYVTEATSKAIMSCDIESAVQVLLFLQTNFLKIRWIIQPIETCDVFFQTRDWFFS